MQHPQVGMPVLFFPAGQATPFAGLIVSLVDENASRVNISYFDQGGQSQVRPGVPVAEKADAAGDYVVLTGGEGTDKAVKAHRIAMATAQQNQPAEQDQSPKAVAERKRVEAAAKAAGDFSSATSTSDNKQPAGSGGPFDPANTAKAHMSVHQTQESASPGLPTTGGVTPKLSPETMGQLSERDREAAQAIEKAKTPKEKAQLANSGTGAATPGTAKAIVQAGKDAAKGPDKAAVKKSADEAAAKAPKPAAVPTEEQNRLARDEAKHKVAVKRSAEVKAERSRAPAKKAAAKKAPARAAKKAPAKKAVAKKSRR